jgi:hypothetical protein
VLQQLLLVHKEVYWVGPELQLKVALLGLQVLRAQVQQ